MDPGALVEEARVEPPYRRIAGQIAQRIADGDLAPGARVPSTRQIVQRYGVAMATASKVLAELRRLGLVRAEPGIGTVVAAPARGARPARPAARASTRDDLVAAAVRVADAEGLAAVSMRRLAGETGVPTMSLYRHVTDKEELLLLMMDRVFAAYPLPDPAPDGPRARLEALSRLQWTMYRRHPWLAQAVSFTRPLLAPHAMAHTEWAMRALDGHGFDGHRLFLTAVMLANYVRGTAVNLEAEAQAEQETGLTDEQWMNAQQDRFAAVLAGGGFPMMERYATEPDADFGLDELMEYGLQRLLDGIDRVIAGAG
jgi:DNA-binding transcriptional regulator YhcF (GntR family)